MTALYLDLERKMQLREALLAELRALDEELDGYFRALSRPRPAYKPNLGLAHGGVETTRGLIRAALLTGPLSEPSKQVPFQWLLDRCEDIAGADRQMVRDVLSSLIERGVVNTARGRYWRVS